MFEDCAVVVLDIKIPEPQNRIKGVLYLKCDISKFDEVLECKQQVEEQYGTVTVLINNAGVRFSYQSLEQVPLKEIYATFDVNLIGSFHTTKAFLPGMRRRQRGTIVFVGSALSFISPAGLAAYGASKAGILSLYESVSYENKDFEGVETQLVCPGHLNTSMFADIKTPSKILAPVLAPESIAEDIVTHLKTGRTRSIYSPLYVYAMPLMRALPRPVQSRVRAWAGIDKVRRVGTNVSAWSSPRVK